VLPANAAYFRNERRVREWEKLLGTAESLLCQFRPACSHNVLFASEVQVLGTTNERSGAVMGFLVRQVGDNTELSVAILA
jgi:hypothetical protein